MPHTLILYAFDSTPTRDNPLRDELANLLIAGPQRIFDTIVRPNIDSEVLSTHLRQVYDSPANTVHLSKSTDGISRTTLDRCLDTYTSVYPNCQHEGVNANLTRITFNVAEAMRQSLMVHKLIPEMQTFLMVENTVYNPRTHNLFNVFEAHYRHLEKTLGAENFMRYEPLCEILEIIQAETDIALTPENLEQQMRHLRALASLWSTHHDTPGPVFVIIDPTDPSNTQYGRTLADLISWAHAVGQKKLVLEVIIGTYDTYTP